MEAGQLKEICIN